MCNKIVTNIVLKNRLTLPFLTSFFTCTSLRLHSLLIRRNLLSIDEGTGEITRITT